MSPVSPCDLPIFDGQNARALLEQLRKAAGGGVADHLGDLSHGEIGVDEQVLRLAHPPPLNVLCDAAPKLPLEAAFQLRLAHAGDAGQAFQWNIEGIVVSDMLTTFCILSLSSSDKGRSRLWFCRFHASTTSAMASVTLAS